MVALFLFVIGLAIGSYEANLTYRIVRGRANRGRSVCPHCRSQILARDNIPVVSFLLLGGKCRNCHKPISIRYLLIELTSGIGFVLIGLNVLWLFVFSLLLCVFVTDIEKQLIPDEFVFIGFLGVLAFFLLKDYGFIYRNFFAALATANFLLFLNLITKGRGMGLGDVKLALFGGFLLSPLGAFIWMLVSFVIGAVISLILMAFKKTGFGKQIAFGPFLVIGLIITAYWGGLIYEIIF